MKLESIAPNVFRFTDTCNVYVIRDGENALLIDFGDGGVIEALGDIGVKNIEWVLFTHHHREQLQGIAKLSDKNVKFAAPELEKALFEQPTNFRKMNVTLGDAFTVHGASFVRPPIAPIKLGRTFKTMDDFTWRGREIVCVDTRGNSPGGMSYLLRNDDKLITFCGDAVHDSAKIINWFDSEWDYGFGAGVYAMYGAASLLECYNPSLLCPSHGPVIRDGAAQCAKLREKLKAITPLYLRGWDVNTFAVGDQDVVSKPTSVPHLWQITPHLYKFKGPNFWPNFTMLLADGGKALIVDCGLFDPAFLDKTFSLMQQRLGLKQIEAIFVTHAHGDHFLEAEHVRKKWGAKLWTMNGIQPYCESPERYEFCAPIQSYGSSIERGIKGVRFDRTFDNGSTLEWEGYTLAVDWMPGQTAFACCLHGDIDGKHVAFTGDNIFGSPTDARQTGHEAVVARNFSILEEGYLYAANYLHGIAPDLLIGGHSWVMAEPREFIERYRKCAEDLREAFRGLSTESDYRYWFDPYWVKADPYRVTVKRDSSGNFTIWLRNYDNQPATFRVALHCPSGLKVEPAEIVTKLAAESVVGIPAKITASSAAAAGVNIVAFDITRNDHRYGQLFDFIANVVD